MGNKELIEKVLESQGLDPKQVAEIIGELSELDFGTLDPTVPKREIELRNQELELKRQLDAEENWRHRARLAARIISLNLE